MEEDRRRRVEEAILSGSTLQVIHSVSPGKPRTLTLAPRAVVKRDFFLWVHAFCAQTNELGFFRIDRITLPGTPD